MKAKVYKDDGISWTRLETDDGYLIAEARGVHTLHYMIKHFGGGK